MGAAAKLYVERKSDKDIKMRDLYLTVDGQAEQTLLYGQSLEIALEPGEHRLRATNRLYHDEATFTVREGETVRFEGINIQKGGLLNLVALVSGAVLYKPILKRL